MEKNLEQLISQCEKLLDEKEYNLRYKGKIQSVWEDLSIWMKTHDFQEFDENIGNKYCDEVLGDHLVHKEWKNTKKKTLRSVRMLISVQKTGSIEFRSPRKEYIFDNELGKWMEEYLDYLATEVHRSTKTIAGRTIQLEKFLHFLNNRNLKVTDITSNLISEFFEFSNYSLASKKVATVALKDFLKYIYDKSYVDKDYSVHFQVVNYRKNSKIPTTYTEEEIQRIISVIDRASKKGKRDYLIMLLAAEYGWRAGDIVEFQFKHIDWDQNTISFTTEKTQKPVVFPLLQSVGNAIIDYLKHARPKSDTPYIIVSFQKSNYGEKMSTPNIHSIVAKYMKTANVEDWQNKKHGPHSLRHSLATNMLKRNESLPIISTVLSHQSTESTRIYLKVDTEKLRYCCLPIPELKTNHYKPYRKEDEQ